MLGPSNRGALEVLTLIPYLLVSFGNLGIGNANLHFVGKKKYSIQQIAANSLVLSLILGAVLLVIAYGSFLIYRGSVFKDIAAYYTHFAFFLIPFLLFQKFIQYTLLGEEEIAYRNIIVAFPAVINFLVVLILVLVFRLSILGVLSASLASNVFAAVLCYILVSKKTKINLRFDYQLFVKSVKFGIIPFLALVIMNLNFKADVFLIKYYLDNTAVGLYSLGVSVVEKITLLPEAIGLVLFSRISNISEDEANNLTPLVCRWSLLFSAIAGFILLVFADFLIPFVYGNEFQLSVNPLMILIPGIISLTIFLILHGDLTGRGKAKVTLYIFLGALVLNIVLNLFLIPAYGINGAALASTLSYSIGALGLVITFSRVNSVPLSSLLWVEKGDVNKYVIPAWVKMRAKLSI
jgi:O-antigen/teichoic acid export membrane protein